MKPQKFVASTSRAALAKVREALGDDAVILSNRSTAHGVEVRAIAERDFESLVGPDNEAIELDPHEGASIAAPEAHVRVTHRTAGGVDQSSNAASQRAERPQGSESPYTPAYWSAESEAPKPFRFVDYVRSKLASRPAATAGYASNSGLPGTTTSSPASPNIAAFSANTSSAGALNASGAGVGAAVAGSAVAGVLRGSDRSAAGVPGASTQSPSSVDRAATSAAAVLVREHVAAPPEPRNARGVERARGADRDARVTAGSSRPGMATATQSAAAEAAGAVAATTADARPILDELRALRDFMAERFEQLGAGADAGGQLVEAMLRRELLEVGFDPMIVRAALESLPQEFAAAQARDWVEARLARSLVCSAADIVDGGGVFALTGATGVGKTTTAAKLAARCAVRYGADSVGLITTDTYRIGAPDQLRIYGKILGVPVHTVHDPQWLQRTLETLAGRRLVIIDTMGMGQRDGRVAAHLEMLDRCQVKRVLLLAASSQPETQEEVIDLYGGRNGAGTILTKIDETVKLAPTLGVLLRYRLKLRYVTNGQRVPEDLQGADATSLVRVALKPPTRSGQADVRVRDAASGR